MAPKPNDTRDRAGRSGWALRAEHELARRGRRAGGARAAVIDLLAAEGGCLGADDVVEKLEAQGRSIGTASVYRALALLTELGLLHKVALPEAPVRFELVLPGGEHHHHIVCDRCGRTVPFSDEELETAIEAVSARSPFRIEAHEITLHGTCRRCQAADS